MSLRKRKEELKFTDILGNVKTYLSFKKNNKKSINKEFHKSVGDYEYMYLNI